MTDKEFEPQTGNFDSSLSAIMTSLAANPNSNPRNHTLEFEYRCRINNLLPAQQANATQAGESMLVTLRQRSDCYGEMARCDVLEGLSHLASKYPPAQVALAKSFSTEENTDVKRAARRYLVDINTTNRTSVDPETLAVLLSEGEQSRELALDLIVNNSLSGFSDCDKLHVIEAALGQMLPSENGPEADIKTAIAVSHLAEKTQRRVSEHLMQQSTAVLTGRLKEIVERLSQKTAFDALLLRVTIENYIQAREYIKSQQGRKDLSPQTVTDTLVLHELPVTLPEEELGAPEIAAIRRLQGDRCQQFEDIIKLQTLSALLSKFTREKLRAELLKEEEIKQAYADRLEAEKKEGQAALERKKEEEAERKAAKIQVLQANARNQSDLAAKAPTLFPDLFGQPPASTKTVETVVSSPSDEKAPDNSGNKKSPVRLSLSAVLFRRRH